MTLLDEMADKYAKLVMKKEMKKVSKIMYKAVFNSFKEGSMRNGIDVDFCRDECKMYNTEFRCRDCKK